MKERERERRRRRRRREALFVLRTRAFFLYLFLGCRPPPAPSHLFRSSISVSAPTKRRSLDARHRVAQGGGKTSGARGRLSVLRDGLACEKPASDARRKNGATTKPRLEKEERLAIVLVASLGSPLPLGLPRASFSRSSSMPQRGAMSARIREARWEAG